jgi:hypothetical protein
MSWNAWVRAHHPGLRRRFNVWLEQGCALKHLSGEGKQRSDHGRSPGRQLRMSSWCMSATELLLSRDGAPGEVGGENGHAGRIPCAQPEVLDSLRVGERVFIDDGQIGAEVERLDEAGAWLRITRARPGGRQDSPGQGPEFSGQ